MISIDEAIAKYKEKAEYFRTTTNVAYALEMKQLAEWLEELKDLREIKEAIECNAEVLEQQGYDNAIEDFTEHIRIYYALKQEMGYVATTYEDLIKFIFETAEQLKKGGKHE